MEAWGIAGIQQVGLGTRDLPGTFGWARRSLGFDVPVFSDEGEAGLLGGAATFLHVTFGAGADHIFPI